MYEMNSKYTQSPDKVPTEPDIFQKHMRQDTTDAFQRRMSNRQGVAEEEDDDFEDNKQMRVPLAMQARTMGNVNLVQVISEATPNKSHKHRANPRNYNENIEPDTGRLSIEVAEEARGKR